MWLQNTLYCLHRQQHHSTVVAEHPVLSVHAAVPQQCGCRTPCTVCTDSNTTALWLQNTLYWLQNNLYSLHRQQHHSTVVAEHPVLSAQAAVPQQCGRRTLCTVSTGSNTTKLWLQNTLYCLHRKQRHSNVAAEHPVLSAQAATPQNCGYRTPCTVCTDSSATAMWMQNTLYSLHRQQRHRTSWQKVANYLLLDRTSDFDRDGKAFK